jgi:hypothetical protein
MPPVRRIYASDENPPATGNGTEFQEEWKVPHDFEESELAGVEGDGYYWISRRGFMQLHFDKMDAQV